MQFRNEKVDKVLVIQNCDAKTLEHKISNLSGTIIDLQFSTTKAWHGETLHNALVLVTYI